MMLQHDYDKLQHDTSLTDVTFLVGSQRFPVRSIFSFPPSISRLLKSRFSAVVRASLLHFCFSFSPTSYGVEGLGLLAGDDMGWLRSVESIKFYVSFAEYCQFYGALLQKR